MKKLRLVISHIFLEDDTKLKISSEIEPPLKDTLFVNCARSGTFLHKILVKYASFKEVTMICGLPDKPWQVNTHSPSQSAPTILVYQIGLIFF